MMYENSTNPYAVGAPQVAAFAIESERLSFIRKTYSHMTAAIIGLIAIVTALFQLVPAETMNRMVGAMLGGYGWLLVLGAFMAVSWVARSWATSGSSQAIQYAGLALYVVAQAVILMPLLYICIRVLGEPRLPVMAALITSVCFVGLTAFTFMTGADFSGWGKFLALGGLAAMAVIIAGILFGFSMGLWFSGLMVLLSCGYILYDTSNIMHHYATNQHVAAALALFASVVLLFWYVLQILMSTSRD
jgi:FtsH-binding integral membrane protein